eukprot:Rmarinus@m.2383
MLKGTKEGQYLQLDEDSDGSVSERPNLECTVDELIEEHVGFGRFQWRLMFINGACWMADAMEMMLLSFLSVEVGCIWELTEWEEAFITTSVFIGMCAGAATWGLISDKYGRRKTYMMVAVFTFVAGLASAAAPNYPMLLLLRALVGFGVAGSHVAFTLFAEFLPSKSRAYSLLGIEVFWALGGVIETGIAWLCLTNPSSLGWRWMLLMSAIPLFFLIFLFPLVPESPRYLLVKGDTEGALRVIRDAAICNNRGIPPFKKLAPIHHAPPTAVHPAVEETTPPASVAPPTVIGAESGSQASAEKRANADRSNSASSTEGNNAVRRGQLGELLKPAIWKTTVLLWVVWFGCTQVYYGIILLITKMFSLENSGTRCPSYHTEESAELASCVDGHINLTHDEFSDILVTSFGELPGLLLTAVIINNIGRKKTLSVELLLTGLCAVLVMPCTSRAFETTMLFGIRMFVSGAFQVGKRKKKRNL